MKVDRITVNVEISGEDFMDWIYEKVGKRNLPPKKDTYTRLSSEGVDGGLYVQVIYEPE